MNNIINQDQFKAKLVGEYKKEGKAPSEIMKLLNIKYPRYKKLSDIYELMEKDG